jgi:uncharacterized protein DUF5916/cellulose/xylan binding protein with CBM9 domain
MRSRACVLFAIALVARGLPASAARPAPAVPATPLPEATAIKLDAEFGESLWGHIAAISAFRQREPRDGAAPTFPTDVKVAYDATNLYVGVWAHDPHPEKLIGMRTRRDTESPSDWIRVMVDSFHDRRSAFEFSVNPAGVKFDRYWSNDTNEDASWDAVWDVAVSRDAGGWRAEFRIPFSQLRFHPGPNLTFGFAVAREIGRLNETDTWPLISKSAPGVVSSFGDLTGINVTSTPKRLEIVPYMRAEAKTQPAEPGNPLVARRGGDAAIGADMKYAIGAGLTLTATVNPDFGQVEADPAVVNLSGFETFFSERRPFFVEGSGMFAFNVDCEDDSCSGFFYPRRIGRPPRGEPSLPDGAYVSVPQQTTILGAAKLTGRVGKYSIGVLNATTSDEEAVIANGPLRAKQSVEPLSDYTVVRARREFSNQSSVGFIFTGTARRLNTDTTFLPSSAVTGGVDWDWRVKKDYAIQGYWAGSTIHGSSDAITRLQESTVHSFQRPDADYLHDDLNATSLDGAGGALTLSKIGGSSVRFTTNVGVKSPGFDYNDLGFMQRADVRSNNNWLQWRHEKPWKRLRTFRVNFNEWGRWNFGGDRTMLGGNVNAHWEFMNNWSTGAGINAIARSFDDRATRGVGPGALTNPKWVYWQYLMTDQRKRLSSMTFFNAGTDHRGSTFTAINPELVVRPASFVTLRGGIEWVHNIDDSQWVENTADGRYVFAHLDQTTLGITTRLNYTITPQLSIEIYAQPFVSAGDYSRFKRLVNGRAPAYADRYLPTDYSSNPDFNYRSFRTTNVLRWEYKPGSALFLVWQQGRADTLSTGAFRFQRDFAGVFGAPSRNVLLLKWSYWINP